MQEINPENQTLPLNNYAKHYKIGTEKLETEKSQPEKHLLREIMVPKRFVRWKNTRNLLKPWMCIEYCIDFRVET